MSYAATDTTLITTGMLPMVILVSAALTAPISLGLLRWYRRAVLRAMSAQAGAAPAEAARSTVAPADGKTLRLQLIDAPGQDAAADPPAYRHARASLVSAAAVYVVAGLAYALVLTCAWLVFTSDDGIVLARTLWLLSCYAWPTVLAVGMLAAVSRGQRVAIGAAYFALLFAVAIYGLARNSELDAWQLVYFWLYVNAPATLLLLAFLRRRVRAVGPLVLAFMTTAVIGAQVFLSVAGSSEAAQRAAVSVGMLLGFGGTQTFYALLVLGFAVFAVAGWWLLKWLGRRYEQRAMSDQSLTLDAIWILFGIVQSITLAFEGWLWVFTGIVAFAVYKVVTILGFTLTRAARADTASPTLLLLRVFALGSRSERLYDALSKRWLRAGSISMIAGPDLVQSTVEPHEFLEFVGGRLSRRFVAGAADLERRIEARHRGPDPDGRYRVSEFFCYADTWKHTMRTLAASADAVLMDLRSFSPSNQGCLYELEQLLDSVPLERIVFLIDGSTDRAFLERALRHAWQSVRPDSPNRRLNAPEVRLLHTHAQKAADIDGLLKLLLAQSAVLPPTGAAAA